MVFVSRRPFYYGGNYVTFSMMWEKTKIVIYSLLKLSFYSSPPHRKTLNRVHITSRYQKKKSNWYQHIVWMLIIFQFYLAEKVIYSHHMLGGRRFGTFIGLLWLCMILAFKLKTISGYLVLWRIVSYTIIDGKVLEPQTQDITYLDWNKKSCRRYCTTDGTGGVRLWSWQKNLH